MGLWVTFDIEVLDDPSFVALASANPEYPWRWMRVVQFAKRANKKGRVLRADGRPVTARDLALAHDRNTSTEELWRDLLATCVEEGLLIEEDGIYRVYDWRRWHRKPSDMPDAVAERVRRHRQNGGVTGRYVTPGNECNASEQSRAEQRQSRAEQQQRRNDQSRGVTSGHESHDTEQSRAEQSRDRAERQRRNNQSRGVTSGHESHDTEQSRAEQRQSRAEQQQRRNDQSRGVTSGHESHDTEQSRAEQSRDRAEQQQSIAHAREGLAAAAEVAIAPEDNLGPESESLYTGRPGRTSLDELRPAIAQAMQALGILGSPSGTWWTSVTAWAAPAIASGATLDDVQDAIRYASAKSAHDRPRRPWPYAMTIASEEIGQIARRNQMRRDWEANGRRGPEPLPYVWTPEEDTCNR